MPFVNSTGRAGNVIDTTDRWIELASLLKRYTRWRGKGEERKARKESNREEIGCMVLIRTGLLPGGAMEL